MTFSLIRATSGDSPIVAELLTERAAWLARRGIAQWSKKDPARDTAATVGTGETWLLIDDTRRAVGTITLSTRADHDFWSRSERAAPALYASKIATRTDCTGQGLGRLLLHAGFMYARRRGLSVLRWDVWRTNEQLQTYYRSLGATLLRVVVVPGRSSGALFEWKAMDRAVWAAGSPHLVAVEAPEGELRQIDALTEQSVVRLGADERDRLQPSEANHVHRMLDLKYLASQEPLAVGPTDVAPSILYHAGDAWRVGQLVVIGSALGGLRPGLVYRIAHAGVEPSCRVALRGDLVQAPQGASV
ncbi:GNAT family N-acetyltransferase [Kribbella speibonae]|uniref:GNAT family N-acetyltransferase n=1 Tax=Kribbella speibonae TaxID=1572660 RepID=UPI0013F4881B|nr:GNAT family N-acetyltransferase [Kribbella speibonae]